MIEKCSWGKHPTIFKTSDHRRNRPWKHILNLSTIFKTSDHLGPQKTTEDHRKQQDWQRSYFSCYKQEISKADFNRTCFWCKFPLLLGATCLCFSVAHSTFLEQLQASETLGGHPVHCNQQYGELVQWKLLNINLFTDLEISLNHSSGSHDSVRILGWMEYTVNMK